MSKKYSLPGWRALASSLLVVGFLFLFADDAQAQANPELPTLKLVADIPTFSGNETFHPDGRLWVPRSRSGGQNREILVPVLIRNCWESYEGIATVEPIKSFTFKVQYDGRALRAIGVQKIGPGAEATYSHAQNFRLEWSDAEDTLYKTSLGASPEQNGRRIRISGTTSDSLALTPGPLGVQNPPCNDREFVELLYIRFEVRATPSGLGDNSPIIITNDTLLYNDRDVTEPQFSNSSNPGEFAGLGGLNNTGRFPYDLTEPTRPGVLYLRVTEIPEIGFGPSEGTGAVIGEVPNTNGAEWEILNPMTLDSASIEHGGLENKVRRRIDVKNLIEETRLTDITVVSDQPWLKFSTVSAGKNPIPFETRKGFIDYIDNSILGGRDPLGNLTQPDPILVLEIICDANALEATGSPAGVYTGYITFYSASALISPVRVKVTFILFRNPIEPNTSFDVTEQNEVGRGIEITVSNSANPPQETNLLFGTGDRATLGVDLLFGEVAQTDPLVGFGARWYPQDDNGEDVVPNGLGDLTGRSASLDVRDGRNSKATLVYTCRFNAGNPSNFPITLSWDTQDFPEGSQLFLRDEVNGTIFSTDMRKASKVPGSDTRFTFTIEDARINSFVIEYTPPKSVRIPELNRGWNLISLPVRPGNPFYRAVYVNALESPKFFSANDYVPEPDGELRFGVGYFVKYGAVLDEFIGGVQINKIGANTPYQVVVHDGWNTIGALSTPVDVEKIILTSYQNNPEPERVGGVYRYNTNRGYEEVSFLSPGVGYWLKIRNTVNTDLAVGILNMEADLDKVGAYVLEDRELAISTAKEIVVSDRAGRNANLYMAAEDLVMDMSRFELPPVPGANLWDVRFGNNRYIDNVADPIVRINGADYPVQISVNDAAARYVVVNAITGEELGVISNGSSVSIEDSRVEAVKLMKSTIPAAAFTLGQSTPNPVSNVATISFSVPESNFVTITLYNTLGQEVAVLANGHFDAGTHNVTLNASTLKTGTYIYKITAGDYTATRTLTVAK